MAGGYKKKLQYAPLRYWIILVITLIFAVCCTSYYQVTVEEIYALEYRGKNGTEFEYLDITTGINLSKTRGNMIDPQRSNYPQIAASGSNVYVVWHEEGHKLLTGSDYITYKTGLIRNGDVLFKKSTDGGNSFGKTIRLNNNTNASVSTHPRIAVEDNNIYVVWVQDGKHLIFKRSNDGGNSFGEAIKIGEFDNYDYLNEIAENPTLLDFNLNIVASNSASNRNVYVFWDTSEHREDNGMRLIRSFDGGNSFGKTIDLSNDPHPDSTLTQLMERYDCGEVGCGPSVAISGDSVYVLEGVFPTGNVLFKKSTDGGNSFGKTIRLNNNTNASVSTHPRIAVEDNNIYVVWVQDDTNLIFKRSNDGGNGFGEAIKIGEVNEASRISFKLNIAASNNNVYVLWPDGSSINDGNLLFKKSSDGGENFGEAIRIAEEVGLKERHEESNIEDPISSQSVRLYAHENDVHILWYGSVYEQIRIALNASRDMGLPVQYWRYSTDAGNSFGKTIVLDDAFLSKPAVSGKNVYLVWTEEEELIPYFVYDQEVYFMATDWNHIQSQPLSSLLSSFPLRENGSGNPKSNPLGSEIAINGRIDDLGYKVGEYAFPLSPWTFEINNYTISLGSSNDTKNMYIYAAVEREPQYNFKGNVTLILVFNGDHSGILREGDDAIILSNNLSNSNAAGYPFVDMFWNRHSNSLQRDVNYGGSNDGSAANSFLNGIEYFELSHPLCSKDRGHDFCLSPDTVLGFFLVVENKSQITSVTPPATLMYFSAMKGVHTVNEYNINDSYDCSRNIFRGCYDAAVATSIIQPAAFILEALSRIDPTERENFLGVLNETERNDLENSPTVETLENFLTKLTSNELYRFLNELSPSELSDTSYIMTNERFEALLDKLSQADRSTLLNKLKAID